MYKSLYTASFHAKRKILQSFGAIPKPADCCIKFASAPLLRTEIRVMTT